MASQPDGTTSVYELNVSYLDALCTPEEAEDEAIFTRKAVAAHNILLSVVGVPAIYVHSLLGSRSDLAAAQTSGIPRRVNRPILDADRLDAELADGGRRRLVLDGLSALLARRQQVAAFSPWSAQEVLQLDPRVFAVRRIAGDGTSVVSLTNVTCETVSFGWGGSGRDLLTGDHVKAASELRSYEVRWIEEWSP